MIFINFHQKSVNFVKQVVLEDEAKLTGIPSGDCSKIMLWSLRTSTKTPRANQQLPPVRRMKTTAKLIVFQFQIPQAWLLVLLPLPLSLSRPLLRLNSPENLERKWQQSRFNQFFVDIWCEFYLQPLRGLLRLKSLMESFVVDRQAMNTIRCMQVFVRVHSQIRSRRLRKLEENQALQKRLLQKHTKELEIFQIAKGWNDSTQSKEQVEAKLQSKHEAAMRRERALAYAFSQQKISRNSSRSINPLFTDPNNPTWGWSWLERWMAAQQWGEVSSGISRGEIDKADALFELSSITSSTVSQSESHRYTFQPLSHSSRRRPIAEPKKLKWSSRKENSVPEIEGLGLTLEANSPTASRSESHRYTFPSLSTPSPQSSVAVGTKSKQLCAINNSIPDDDYKSVASIQSNRSLRHSNGGPRSSLWDEESQTRSPILPSYMTLTESSRAKSRLQSPIEMENNEARERTSFGSSAKKHLLYPPSPVRSRRYSDRLKVDNGLNE